MIVSVKETIQTPLYIRKYRQLHPHSPPQKDLSSPDAGSRWCRRRPRRCWPGPPLLLLLLPGSPRRPHRRRCTGLRLRPGWGPCIPGRRGPSRPPACTSGRPGRTGPPFFLGTEGIGQRVDDRKAKMGERCGGMIRGGSGDAAVLERRRGGEQREREREGNID